MNIDLLEHYHIALNAPYSAYDGIYKVLRGFTYRQIVDDDIDLVTNFYTKFGADAQTYKDEAYSLVSGAFYEFESVLNGEIIIVPAKHIKHADPRVREYKRMMVNVDAGLFEVPETAYPIAGIVKGLIKEQIGTRMVENNTKTIRTMIKELLEAQLNKPAVDGPANTMLDEVVSTIETWHGSALPTGTELEVPVDPEVAMYVYATEWIRAEDYEELIASREAARAATPKRLPDSVFEENSNLKAELREAREKIGQLETVIIAHVEA